METSHKPMVSGTRAAPFAFLQLLGRRSRFDEEALTRAVFALQLILRSKVVIVGKGCAA
jgi:hypothetical protein